MSMISELVDRLRNRAHELESLAPGLSAPYVVPSTKEIMALAMTSAASEVRYAADTICALHEKLAGMVDMRERARIAEAENDKLRKLVRDMSVWAYISDYCDLEEQFADRMRELGIEVDE